MSATTQPNSPSLHAHPHACAALAEALFNDPFYQAVTIDHAANTVRRLQVLAAGCAGPVFLCRPATAARESSAAPLRLLARVGADWELLVNVFKRKGPPLETTLHLLSVPGGLQAILTPRLQKPSTLLPLEPAPHPIPHPSEAGHALVSAPAAGTRRHRLAH